MKMMCISYLLTGEINKVEVWLLVIAILAIIPNIASLFDLESGRKASKRLGIFRTTSYGLRQTISKDKEYMTYFFLFALIDCCLSFFVDIPILSIICAISETLIEILSVRENMHKGQSDTHDPIELMKAIATTYGQDKADKIFDIIKKSKENESK